MSRTRLTRRGKIAAVAVAVLVGTTLGMTAQYWNPYTAAVTDQADRGVVSSDR